MRLPRDPSQRAPVPLSQRRRCPVAVPRSLPRPLARGAPRELTGRAPCSPRPPRGLAALGASAKGTGIPMPAPQQSAPAPRSSGTKLRLPRSSGIAAPHRTAYASGSRRTESANPAKGSRFLAPRLSEFHCQATRRISPGLLYEVKNKMLRRLGC